MSKRRHVFKKIANEHKACVIVVVCVMCACTLFATFLVIKSIPKYSCIAGNNSWDDERNECILSHESALPQKIDEISKKPCVVDDNGVEQCYSQGGITLNNGDNHRVAPTISFGTLSKLGIETKTNKETGEATLNTGSDYLYVNPETKMYERVTSKEVAILKESGKICLNADEAWQNIGKDTCVVFFPEYYHSSDGIIFMDEKRDYNNGFVAPIMKDFISFNKVAEEYGGRVILVSGTIERYKGHPEIKVYTSRQIVQKPIVAGYSSKSGIIYRPE